MGCTISERCDTNLTEELYHAEEAFDTRDVCGCRHLNDSFDLRIIWLYALWADNVSHERHARTA